MGFLHLKEVEIDCHVEKQLVDLCRQANRIRSRSRGLPRRVPVSVPRRFYR